MSSEPGAERAPPDDEFKTGPVRSVDDDATVPGALVGADPDVGPSVAIHGHLP
jgi:hypothetical protein